MATTRSLESVLLVHFLLVTQQGQGLVAWEVLMDQDEWEDIPTAAMQYAIQKLVEVGGHPDTAPHPPPAVPAPPASILYVSNSVAPDMDELTNNVSEWGGVSVPTSHRSQHSCGGNSGSRMEWTWRTATELNMPNSPKLLNSVQEEFCEVSEPNPMGNAVMPEETHGNAVVGVAAASAVAQPPVDTVSLASSCTNKCHHTRHTSSGQLHHSSASVPT